MHDNNIKIYLTRTYTQSEKSYFINSQRLKAYRRPTYVTDVSFSLSPTEINIPLR